MTPIIFGKDINFIFLELASAYSQHASRETFDSSPPNGGEKPTNANNLPSTGVAECEAEDAW